ncbi:MAG: hypothetical protein ACR2PH_05920, partial [Desulfobulbia bacterium]
MEYQSHAEWPDHVYTNELGKHISTDKHLSKEEADSACRGLEREGFGGMGKEFPIQTWTAPVPFEDRFPDEAKLLMDHCQSFNDPDNQEEVPEEPVPMMELQYRNTFPS